MNDKDVMTTSPIYCYLGSLGGAGCFSLSAHSCYGEYLTDTGYLTLVLTKQAGIIQDASMHLMGEL